MRVSDALAWCESKLGQALDFDGQYGAQCVDLFNFYFQFLTGQNPYDHGFGVNSAYQIFNVRVGFFDHVENNPNDPNQLPPAGSILIHKGSLPGSGGHGHVSIIASCDGNAYTVYEQNWGGMFVKKQTHPWTGHEYGWMVFKSFEPEQPPRQPHQRVVGATGVNARQSPDTGSVVTRVFDAGETLDFRGFVRGQDPYGAGNNVWFVGAYNGEYFYSGAFDDPSTNGLVDITPPPVVTLPDPVPTPVEPPVVVEPIPVPPVVTPPVPVPVIPPLSTLPNIPPIVVITPSFWKYIVDLIKKACEIISVMLLGEKK